MTGYSLFSGSSGNCIYLREENTEILIDAGGSMKKIETALQEIGSSLSQISAIFITHEHSDHTRALPTICGKFQIPVYCQKKVAKEIYLELLRKEKKRDAAFLAKCIRTVEPGFEYEIGSILISPFSTPHDSVESQGFVIGEKLLGIATDLGHVTSEVENYLLGCKTVVMESNHDLEMLWNGPYPAYLKERVASDFGHLSNSSCSEFVKKLFLAGCQNFTLFHLSEENNTPETALLENQKALEEVGAALGEEVFLRVAARFEVTKIL